MSIEFPVTCNLWIVTAGRNALHVETVDSIMQVSLNKQKLTPAECAVVTKKWYLEKNRMVFRKPETQPRQRTEKIEKQICDREKTISAAESLFQRVWEKKQG